jgi:hypothetical protein
MHGIMIFKLSDFLSQSSESKCDKLGMTYYDKSNRAIRFYVILLSFLKIIIESSEKRF